ncbi:unnamed protein product [Didymodactylos carnosus]|uniref:Glycoside hydrolase family 31 N-terminal domain-containing protein n=1 Tax=Didymodactylos carnosus TaxID=1234261 RepID=A0A815WBE6_9BILA|nr:unnamed protein product [Didymodactylos carnosus]CAF1542694.1 unnamed protein product [Didymodactylos carnosus]CAF4102491.1 unnamed protein product [Didymodactylos carnosus]CAF4403189.1 unnamed protein product [Didymodactylos carnosus]
MISDVVSSEAIQQSSPLQYEIINNSIIFTHQNDTKYVITIVEENIVRIRVWPQGKPLTERTWSIINSSQAEDVPFEGNKRHDDIISMKINYTVDKTNLTVFTGNLKLEINLYRKFAITWKNASSDLILATDNHLIPYEFTPSRRHTLSRFPNEYYYGLGEKSGPMVKNGRRYRMRNTDAFGYNAELSDPLYKHIPFYITLRECEGFGLFYDTSFDCTFDFGCEIDNYYGDIRYFETVDYDLDYYFIYGPLISNVVERFTNLTGRPPLPPKWTLGYLGSAMKYTDAPNAQEMLAEFVKKCEQTNITCTGFHLSSGYSMSDDGKRYVFVWNKSRIPLPSKMTETFHNTNMKVIANIKPALLNTHPLYEECHQLFIKNRLTNEPDLQPFWGGTGSHLDFTNPETILWWQKKIQEQLLFYGVDYTWNDNNEFNIRDSQARCNNFGHSLPIEGLRPIQTLLMVKASYDAQIKNNSILRPFVLSRAGSPGLQRYAWTWTGDNRCSYHTLKYNIPMGLGLSISGISFYGNDVGGFTGDIPSPALFVRWVQNGIFYPRFCVHSWRINGEENALWMFPNMLPIIHEALNFRTSLLPYLYCLLWETSQTGSPVTRPTVYHYQHDPNCYEQSYEFLLGKWLLVASVYEENATKRIIYLPIGNGWYNFHTGTFYNGGQTVTIDSPLNVFPLFAREGALIPMRRNDRLEIHAFSYQINGTTTFPFYDDDGITFEHKQGQFKLHTLSLHCNENQIQVSSDGLDVDWIFYGSERENSRSVLYK